MMWRWNPTPIPQADGDSGAPTRAEPYPQLSSVQQDEAIAWLNGVVKDLLERVERIEKQLAAKK